MEHSLLDKAKEQINLLKKKVEFQKYSTDSIVKKEYNYEFNAFGENGKVKLLLYFGKKGLKLILQGDDKSQFYKTINSIVNEQQTLDLGEKEIDEPDEYIGTDEVGKGDLFGPLVVAAAYVDNSTKEKLKRIGVRDSKDLSDFQIGILAEKIRKICGDQLSIISLVPDQYNKQYEKYKNLNKLLSQSHSKAIEKLLDNIDAKFVITDKFSNQGLEIHRDAAFTHVTFMETERAERFIGVAAASIIARDTFIRWFIEREKEGIDFPKGSSDKAKFFLERFIKVHGKEELYKYAKLHFKTIKNC